MAAHQLAALRERIQTATSVVGVVGQLEAIRRAVRQADEQATTPQSKQMIASLSIALQGMQWIAKATPGIEPMIQQYGDAGQAMLLAAARIEARIQETQKGLFVQGRPDGGRLQAFDAQFPDLAEERDMANIMPLPGVRDAYIYPQGEDGIALVWDPAAGRWYRPDLTPQEVLRRYAFYATFGNPDPTPSEVLGDLSAQLIGLTIEAEHSVVEPGGATLVHVLAERLDGSAVEYLGVKLSVREEMALMGGGDPGQVVPTVVDPEPEDVALWQAPRKENSVFTITASLPEDEEVYRIIKPATCSVATGGKSQIIADAQPTEVEPGGDGVIEYFVTDAYRNWLKPKAAVTLFADGGLEVEPGEWVDESSAHGLAAYHAPNEPGVYAVRLFFPGYMDAGYIYGSNYMAAQATVTVKVLGEPEPIVAQAQPDEEEDDEDHNTQVPAGNETQEQEQQPQGLNLIPGTYESHFYDDGGYTTVVVLSGGPDGIGWQLDRSYHDQHQFTWSGTVTPTGEVREGCRILGGYYQQPGRNNQSWAEIPVRQDGDGNWVPGYLRSWGGGRPQTPHRGTIFYLTKRE